MTKRTLALVLVCVMIVAAFAGCSQKANEATPTAASTEATGEQSAAPVDSGEKIKIGGLAPLTGDVSIYGIAANNGIKLALDEINAAGGVLGKQIEYIVYDEKGDSTEAVNAYNKLVENDKVVAIIGDVTSTPTIAVAQLAAQIGIPMITATGTNADITAAGTNVFRACFIDPFQGEVMASYAYNKLGAKKAAILYDVSDDYSTGLQEAFAAKAKELGMEVVATESYTKGDVDFKSQLTKIAGLAPDVLFLPEYYEDIALMGAQVKEIGLTATLLGADGWDGVLDKVDASNVDAFEGALFCNHYSSESTDEKLQAFVTNYTAAYNVAPNSFAALGYDAAYMMVKAIETAGSTDYAAVVEAMTNIDFSGITGNIKFDENRNPIKSAAITSITSGAYKFVEYYDM